MELVTFYKLILGKPGKIILRYMTEEGGSSRKTEFMRNNYEG